MGDRVRHRNRVAARGYTQLENVVLFDVELHAGARVLYAALKHFDWKHDGDVPSQPELAERLGFGERSVRRYVAELEARNLLTIERRLGESLEYVIEEPTTPANLAGVTPAKLATGPRPKRPGLSTEGVQDKSEDSPASAGRPQAAVEAGDKDALYAALRRTCFKDARLLTQREAKKAALAATELARVGAVAGDVDRFVAAWRAHPTYKDCALTPMAMASHWNELLPRRPGAACPACGVGGGTHAEDCPTLRLPTPPRPPQLAERARVSRQARQSLGL